MKKIFRLTFPLIFLMILCNACNNETVQKQENTRELLPDPEKYKKDTFYTNDTAP